MLDSGLFERAYHAGSRDHLLKLFILRCRTETLRSSFGVRFMNLWNSLPREILERECLVGFKRGFYVCLWNKLFDLLRKIYKYFFAVFVLKILG